ncbi:MULTISPECIES: type IV pilin protein [unclassified Ketobacter]|uniref:type IV pilin protein n=1 Tax=unclassified Ketobacter TaxID=2639109 RepID=UPI000F0DA288|nr:MULTISPECIES: type IV pilin protein [unclassified Ketobacter]RLT88207.1 MAG: prepilin-type N-terminal cleavage/methylation domain-containing protein [Ketobacter sp. GenoA1]RLT94113.1 MAG: prepilin-type N-terminal cleavage/methylation domain-containing protein [Ketobacter sp.]
MMKRQLGFSLIELMIAIAIIGVIAAFALPSYTKHLRETRRADARSALQEAAARQERIYTEANSYTGDVSRLVTNADGSSSPEGYYDISANLSCDRTVSGTTYYSCFTLTATAQGVQADDTDCPALTLTHAGVKAPADCW